MPTIEELLNVDECLFFLSCFCLPPSDFHYEAFFSFLFSYTFPSCIPFWPGDSKELLSGSLPKSPLATSRCLCNLFHLGLIVGPDKQCRDGQPPFSALLFSITKMKVEYSLLLFAMVDMPSLDTGLHAPARGFGLGCVICFGPQNVREPMSEHQLYIASQVSASTFVLCHENQMSQTGASLQPKFQNEKTHKAEPW